jgi:hypothetical protein
MLAKRKKKNNRPQQSRPVAAAYVSTGGTSARGDKIDAGTDVIVEEVSGVTTFGCVGYSINPGLEENFESLSKEAERYDCYEFQELSFHFVGTTVITTTVGQIGMAFEPNPNSPPPSSQSKFSAYEAHVSSSVYKPGGLWLHVPRKMLVGKRYVRRGIEGSNLTLYDPGSLIIMARDEASTNVIGYVEVHYKVKFFNFHLEANVTPYRRNVLSVGKTGTQTLVTSTATNWTMDTIYGGGLVYDLTAGNLTLDSGYYLMQLYLASSDTAAEAFQVSIAIRKDGGSVAGGVQETTCLAGGKVSCATAALVPCSSTAVFDVRVTLVGAAGTLTIVGNSSVLIVHAL